MGDGRIALIEVDGEEEEEEERGREREEEEEKRDTEEMKGGGWEESLCMRLAYFSPGQPLCVPYSWSLINTVQGIICYTLARSVSQPLRQGSVPGHNHPTEGVASLNWCCVCCTFFYVLYCPAARSCLNPISESGFNRSTTL